MSNKTFIEPETGNTMTLGRYYVIGDSGAQYMNPTTREGAEGFATEADAFAWCERQRQDVAEPYYAPGLRYARVNWLCTDTSEADLLVWLADDLQRFWLDTEPEYYREQNPDNVVNTRL